MGQKVVDLDIHDGAVWCDLEGHGSSNKYEYMASPASYGRMFAFDAEGQYLLTCGPENGVLYKVRISFGVDFSRMHICVDSTSTCLFILVFFTSISLCT